MPKIKFNNSFSRFSEHLNTANVFEAYCLCHYYFIYQDVPQIDKEELKTTIGLEYQINGREFMRLLGGNDDYGKKGYLDASLIMFIEFFQLKLALAYPDIKIASCRHPEKTKENLMKTIHQIIEKDKSVELSDKQVEVVHKYREFTYFAIHHVLSYLAKHDQDFLQLGKEIFPNFTPSIPNKEVSDLAVEKLNYHIDKYYDYFDEMMKSKPTYIKDIQIKDEGLKNLYEHLTLNIPINYDLFKQELNSYKKGKLGEEIFGKIHNGEVIGHKGGKTDVIENGKNISLKTSYTQHWNHHLAYLNKTKHEEMIESLNNKTPFFKLKNTNWYEAIDYFLSHGEHVDELVFQKVMMDDLNQHPTQIELWRFNKTDILEMVKNNQFIFQNNNIIIFHKKEQFIKLSFKKRTNSYQVLVIAEQSALQAVVEDNLGQYMQPMKTNSKIKP